MIDLLSVLLNGNYNGSFAKWNLILYEISGLKAMVSDLQVELQGDHEVALSARVEKLDDLCRAVKARKVKLLTEEQRQWLMALGVTI